MKEFIEYLLKNIVSKPEEIIITVIEEAEATTYRIKVAKDDMGTVIGKEGKTIHSIRELAKARAIKENVRINVILEEELENAQN